MLGKKLNKKILLLAMVIGLVFFLTLLFYSTSVSSVKPIKSVQSPTINTKPIVQVIEQTAFGLPINLIIPSINVSSTVEYVGLTPDGAMDVPKNQNNVAWLEIGTRPGENGTAVIDGHYGWKDKNPSVFDNLYKLRPGDEILIKDDKGEDIYFVVREMKRYSPGANAKAVFISDDNKSHLNLITCEGAWNKDSKSYSTRLVIFTDKVVK